MHRRYKKLCTLLATGQIEAEEKAHLDQHLKSCSKCRTFLDDVTRIGVQVMPLAAANRAERALAEPSPGIRERFLQRAIAEGFYTKPAPVLAEPVPAWKTASAERADALASRLSRRSWLAAALDFRPLHAALTLTACVAFGVFGYLLALQRHSIKPIVETTGNFVKASLPLGPVPQQIETERIEKERVELQSKLRTISLQLTAADSEKQELAHKLAGAAQQIAKGSLYEQRFKQQASDLQDAEDRVSKLESELAMVQKQLSEREAVLVAQQQVAQDAKSKLADTELQLQKVSELQSARSEIGQLISARNLHIVDVRDTEPGGKRQQAFGRVFYVEGQSLVFYAYDLAASDHPNRQISFHVWGETASVKETTHSLGILHSDDSSQARWVLTFDDPKVLNRINAVYITAEHDTRVKRNPQGRKLLYAFLGTPNHP